MKLISEQIDQQTLEYISEDIDDNKKSFKIKGPFLQAEAKNKNGRIYSRQLIEREVRAFTEEKIMNGRALGELDHPPTPTVNLERVSHIIESITMDGDYGIGVAKILDTPMGRTTTALLREGIRPGMSTRGIGSLTGSKVNNDYKLITADIVSDPSCHSAFVEGILENKNYIIDNDVIVERAVENLEKILNNKGQKAIYEAMNSFISGIKGSLKNDRKRYI
jgi:hypothetical protein